MMYANSLRTLCIHLTADSLQAHGRPLRRPWRGILIFWTRGPVLSLSFYICRRLPELPHHPGYNAWLMNGIDVLIAFMVCIRRRQLFYFNYIVLLVNAIGFTKIMPRFFLMILFEFQFYKQLGRPLTQPRTNYVPSLNIMVTRRSRGTIPPIWCRMCSGAAMMIG